MLLRRWPGGVFIYAGRSVLVVFLAFMLVFSPVAGSFTPVAARGVSDTGDSKDMYNSHGSIMSAAVSYFGSMFALPPSDEDNDVTFHSLLEKVYGFADEALQDERVKDALLKTMANVSAQEGSSSGGSTINGIVVSILRDEELPEMLGDVIASFLLLEEGTMERDLAEQMAADIYGLLQDDGDGSFKEFLRDSLNSFLNDERVSEVAGDILYLLVGYTGDVLSDFESAGSFEGIPTLLRDFADYMRGSADGTEMGNIVAGVLENLADIPDGFVEALREDRAFNRAMDNLAAVFWEALLDPMFGDLGEAGVLEDYLGELVAPDCAVCEEGEPQPGCAQCGGGLWGAFRGLLEMWVAAEAGEDCFSCGGSDPSCPYCPVRGGLGVVLETISDDLDTGISFYSESATGGGGSDCDVEEQMADFLLHWADVLFAMFSHEEFSELLTVPLTAFFTEGRGKHHLEDMADLLMENLHRALELLLDEESPVAPSVRENILDPLDIILEDTGRELFGIIRDMADDVDMEGDFSAAAEEFGEKLNDILADIFPAYFTASGEGEGGGEGGTGEEIQVSEDLIDRFFNNITSISSFSDPGSQVSFEELAGDIAEYMSAVCSDPECNCGRTNAKKTGYELAEGVLNDLADAVDLETEEECEPGCTEESPCIDCVRDVERNALRESRLNTERLEQFYTDLGGAYTAEDEDYPVSEDADIAGIIWAVITEILRGEDLEGFFDSLGDDMAALRDDEDGGLADYGKRIGAAVLGFADRIFAPLIRIINPRRYVNNYNDAERELEALLSEERIASSLHWMISPLHGFLTESRVALYDVHPVDPGGFISYPDYALRQFLGDGPGEYDALGVIASPERISVITGLLAEITGARERKELEAGYFAADMAEDIPGLIEEFVERMNPERLDEEHPEHDGHIDPVASINSMIDGMIDGMLECPLCEGEGGMCTACEGAGTTRGDCVFCNGAGEAAGGGPCANCNGTGETEVVFFGFDDWSGGVRDFSSRLRRFGDILEEIAAEETATDVVNIPARLMGLFDEEENARDALEGMLATPVSPVVDAAGDGLQGEELRGLLQNLIADITSCLAGGLGAVAADIISDPEAGDFMAQTATEIFTFGDLPGQLVLMLGDFLEDDGWIGHVVTEEHYYHMCDPHDDVLETVPVDAYYGHETGSSGGGLEYLLRLSLYYASWYGHPGYEDVSAYRAAYSAGPARFYEVTYREEICDIDFNDCEIGQAAYQGISVFFDLLMDWLRGEGIFDGNDPSNPRVLQRPSAFLPDYFGDFFRYDFAGEFVPRMLDVIINVVDSTLSYEDPVSGRGLPDMAADWVTALFFLRDEAEDAGLLAKLGEILQREYNPEELDYFSIPAEYAANPAEFEPDFAGLLKDVLVGFPDGEGARNLQLFYDIANILKYDLSDPEYPVPANPVHHPPVWMLHKHVGVTFAILVNEIADFLTDGWKISEIAGTGMNNPRHFEFTPGLPVTPGTLKLAVGDQIAVDEFVPCGECGRCSANNEERCENPAGHFVNPQPGRELVQDSPPYNTIDYDTGKFSLSMRATPDGADIVAAWMPDLVGRMKLRADPGQLRDALYVNRDMHVMLYNVLSGGFSANMVQNIVSFLEAEEETLHGEAVSRAFKTGYILEDIPSRFLVDLLTREGEGDAAELAEFAGAAATGHVGAAVIEYEPGRMILDYLADLVNSPALFELSVEAVFGYLTDMYMTFVRRITSFGSFMLSGGESGSAGVQAPSPYDYAGQDAGANLVRPHDAGPHPVIPHAPDDDNDTVGANFVRPQQTTTPAMSVNVETAELLDALEKALKRFDTNILDEVFTELLNEERFHEAVQPLFDLIAAVVSDEQLAETVGGALALNLQDGRLADDLVFFKNALFDLLYDDNVYADVNQFLIDLLEGEETEAYVENLVDEAIEIGRVMIEDAVRGLLLELWPEDPADPASEKETSKMLTGDLITAVRRVLEGNGGQPGMDAQIQDMFTDEKFAGFLAYMGEMLLETGLETWVKFLEDDRFKIILYDMLLELVEYGFSALGEIVTDPGLSPALIEGVQEGISSAGARYGYSDGYEFLQDSVVDLLENLIYKDGYLADYFLNSFYAILEEAPELPAGGVRWAADALSAPVSWFAPEQNIVETIAAELSVIPPDLINSVFFDWLMFGGGDSPPDAGTYMDWVEGVAAALNPELVAAAAAALEETQDYAADFLYYEVSCGDCPVCHAGGDCTRRDEIMHRVTEDLYSYFFCPLEGEYDGIVDNIRDEPRMIGDPENPGFRGEFYREVTVDPAGVDSGGEDFQVQVKLDASNFDFAKARSDGHDIRFVCPSGSFLDFERIYHHYEDETAEYRVELPYVSRREKTRFYIYYGNPDAADAATVLDDVIYFYEDFEGGSFPPAGWTRGSNIGGHLWELNTESEFAYSGDNSAYIEWSESILNASLFTPWVELGEDPRLIFRERVMYQFHENYNDHHRIWLDDGDSFTLLRTMDDITMSWREHWFDLRDYAGEEIRIVFQYYGSDGQNWYIDDVTFADSFVRYDSLNYSEESNVYIPAELAETFVNILPLEEIGTFLDIPVFYEMVNESFRGAAFPPSGWNRTSDATGYNWERSTDVYRSGGASAGFERTEPVVAQDSFFPSQDFDSVIWPPPRWDRWNDPGNLVSGWVKRHEDFDEDNSWASSMAGTENRTHMGDALYDDGHDRGEYDIHSKLYTPWFRVQDLGADTDAELEFSHLEGENDSRASLKKAEVRVEYYNGEGEPVDELLQSYSSLPGSETTVTIDLAEYAGREIRVYFEFIGEGSLHSAWYQTSTRWYIYEWLLGGVSVTGNVEKRPAFAGAALYTDWVEAEDGLIMEFHESSTNSHSYLSHVVEIQDLHTLDIIYTKELGRAPEAPEWRRQRIDIGAFDGRTVRALFRYRGAGADSWYIDDFCIRAIEDYADRYEVYNVLERWGNEAVGAFPLEEVVDDFLDGSCGDCPGCLEGGACENPTISGTLKAAFAGFTQDLLDILVHSDLYHAFIDSIAGFPVENITGFLEEEYDPSGSPGKTRADLIGEVVPAVLLGKAAEFAGYRAENYPPNPGETSPKREAMVDFVYHSILEVIEEFGGGSAGELAVDLILEQLEPCGACPGCHAEELCENNWIAGLLEGLLEQLDGSGAELAGAASRHPFPGEPDNYLFLPAGWEESPDYFTRALGALYSTVAGRLGAETADSGISPQGKGAETILEEGFEDAVFPPQSPDWETETNVEGFGWERYTTHAHTGDASAGIRHDGEGVSAPGGSELQDREDTTTTTQRDGSSVLSPQTAGGSVSIQGGGGMPLSEDFSGSFPPSGWQTTGGDNWGQSTTSNAGGDSPEARFNWNPDTTASQRLITPELDTTGMEEITVMFRHNVNHFASGDGNYELKLQTTSNGGSSWNTIETWPAEDLSARQEVFSIDNTDVGSSQLQVAWVFDGRSYDINQWYVDDVYICEAGEELYTVTLYHEVSEGFTHGDLSDLGGIVSGEGMYSPGDTVTVIAEAASGVGQDFLYWTGTFASSDRIFEFTMPERNVNLTAEYRNNRLYWLGEDHINFTGGANQRDDQYEIREKRSDHLYMTTESSGYSREVSWCSPAVDLTDVTDVNVDWQGNNCGSAGTKEHFFTIATSADVLHDNNAVQEILSEGGNFNRRTESIDVSSRTGDYYISSHARTGWRAWGTRHSYTYTYRIWLDYDGIPDPPVDAPDVLSNPASRTVQDGQSVTFSVFADGTLPFDYQWQRNDGGGWSNITGATDDSYTINAVDYGDDDGAQFRCVVTNDGGTDTSGPATLTVEAIPPSITSQPSNQTVQEGQTAGFSVMVSGTEPFSYQWERSENGGVTWSEISGANSSVYTTPATAYPDDDGLMFRCVISNDGGGVESDEATLTVEAIPPTITSQPTDQEVDDGEAAVFSVSAEGTEPLSYQWERSEDGGSTWSNVGANSDTYTTPSTAYPDDDGLMFRCTVSNDGGDVTSNEVTLTVNAVMPDITAQPEDQIVSDGETATFSLTAEGTQPLSYQWQYSADDGSTWVDISEANEDTYTTPPASYPDDIGAMFRCKVENDGGTTLSNPATLTVTLTAIAPSVTSQPSDQTVDEGETATFSISASGTAPLSYQWERSDDNGNTWEEINGATGSSYTTPDTVHAEDDGARFRCVVTNNEGSDTSDAATLTVALSEDPPEISSHPSNRTVQEGHTASFSVTAEGALPLSYQWQRSDNEGLNWSDIAGADESSYTTPATEHPGDNGAWFRCVVTNAYGSAISSEAILTVYTEGEEFYMVTLDYAVTQGFTGGDLSGLGGIVSGEGQYAPGETVTVIAETGGTGYDFIYWNGDMVSTDRVFEFAMPNHNVDITAEYQNNRIYWYGEEHVSIVEGHIYDAGGEGAASIKYSDYLYKHTGERRSYRPRRMWETSEKVDLTDVDSLVIDWQSTSHDHSWQWVFGNDEPEGDPYDGTDCLWYGEKGGEWSRVVNSWNIGDVGAATGEQYVGWGVGKGNRVWPQDANYGELYVWRVWLGGVPHPEPPVVEPAVTADPADQTVDDGETAFFSVNASGSGPLYYQWERSDDGGSSWSEISGAEGSSYIIPETVYAEDNDVRFRCVVSNDWGNSATSGAATLTVTPDPPNITVNPANQTVQEGQTAGFSVTAEGSEPLSYQWQRSNDGGDNWGNIEGATASSYITPETDYAEDNGARFRCMVTNDGGSDTSAAAILTVTAIPPEITGHPAHETVDDGETATFSVTAEGTEPFTYQWQRSDGGDWSDIEGANSDIYTTPETVYGDDNGALFRCVVSNSGGDDTSHEATLTVTPLPPDITVHPEDQMVGNGGITTFNVTAKGTLPLSYQWEYSGDGGNTWDEIEGETEDTYTIPPAVYPEDDGAMFRCVVSNNEGSAISIGATLTVTEFAIPPEITAHPSHETVDDGEPVTFSVTATGTAPLSYRWQRNDGGGWDDIDGATGSIFTIAETVYAEDDGAMFRCVVSNEADSVASETAVLTVNPLAPQITSHPGNQTVEEGQTAIFNVTATGTEPLSYQWQRSDNEGGSWSDIAGADESSYTTPATDNAEDDGAWFRCRVSNAQDTVYSDEATLMVYLEGEEYYMVSLDYEVTEGFTGGDLSGLGGIISGEGQYAPGDTVTVTAATGGTGYDFLYWSGDKVSTDRVFEFTMPDYDVNIKAEYMNNRIYWFGEEHVPIVEGHIYCVDADGAASIKYNNYLYKHTGERRSYRPRRMWETGDKVDLTDVDSLLIDWESTSHDHSWQWVFGNDSPEGDPYDGTDWRGEKEGEWNRVLNSWNIGDTAAATGEQYVGWGVGKGNRVWPQGANYGELYVWRVWLGGVPHPEPPVQAPWITLHPEDQTVYEGQTAFFSIEVDGTGPMTYQWQRSDDGGTSWDNVGETYRSRYMTGETVYTEDHNARFRCVVTNAAGDVTSDEVTLTVISDPPVITAHPQDQTVDEGETATFSVEVDSGAGPDYQWQRNDGGGWINIEGADEAEYTTPPTDYAADDGALFRCVVSNEGGSVTSEPAELTVLPGEAEVTVQPQDQTVYDGDPATFSMEASGSEPISYQWQLSSDGGGSWFDLPDAHDAEFTINSTVYLDDDGLQFRCKVSNPQGDDTSDAAQLTVLPVPPVITAHPGDQTVYDGDPASFVCLQSGGTVPVSYQWQRFDGTWQDMPGEIRTVYGIDNTVYADDDGAIIRCRVSNVHGSVYSNTAVLTVLPVPPEIAVQPADQTAEEEGTATFSVEVDGTLPMSYGWQRSDDGGTTWDDIPGASDASYTTAELVYEVDEGALFRCVAGNAQGEVISEAAALTVIPALDAFLYTAWFTIDGEYRKADLKFRETGERQNYYAYHAVGVEDEENEHHLLKELGPAPEGSWQERTVDMSAFIGETVRVYFHYQGNNADDWYIDDVEVRGLPEVYDLTLQANPAAGGEVMDNTGDAPYLEDEVVSVTATPNPYYRFVNWTVDGTEVSTEETFDYVMPDEDITLTANFIPAYELNLKAEPEGWGTVTDNTGEGPYPEGEQVEVTAEAEEGYYFVDWSVDGEMVSMDETFVFEMPAGHVTLTATFVDDSTELFMLTVQADPAEGGTVRGGRLYEEGFSVDLVAVPATGYEFVNWTEGEDILSTEAEYSYEMPGADTTVTAHFAIIDYTLTVEAGPNGSVDPEGVFIKNYTDIIGVEATPDVDYGFVNWTANGVAVSTEEVFDYSMAAEDVTLTANFGLLYELTVEADPEEAGTVNGGGLYTAGSIAEVTADAAEGYVFVNWRVNETVISTQPALNFTMPGYSTTLTATFIEEGMVYMPDDYLRSAVGYSLFRPNRDITFNAMQKLYSLTATERDITDLTGLEFAGNLGYLDLYGNALDNLLSLEGLTGLKSLHLSRTGITHKDIEALANLTGLKELDLSHNDISDIGVLAGMENMERLNLGGNNIEDISPLNGLSGLKWLCLGDNDIAGSAENREALASLVNLERLNLSGNPFSNGDTLGSLDNLQRLNLSRTGIDNHDLAGLADMALLHTLELAENGLNDLSQLDWSGFGKLRNLDLSGNSIDNLLPLAGLDLFKLNLADNPVGGELEHLTGYGVLRVLNLSATGIGNDDLSALSGLTSLERLNMGGNNIDNLANLNPAGLTGLRYLILGDNDISDLSLLAGLTLMELDLSYTYDRENPADRGPIDDISPLASVNFVDALWGMRAWFRLGDMLEFEGIEFLEELDGGGYLDLSGNQVDDISALAGKKLQSLDLSGNEIDSDGLEQIMHIDFGGFLGGGLLDLSDNWIDSLEAWHDETRESTHPYAPFIIHDEVKNLDLILLDRNHLGNGVQYFNSDWRRNTPEPGTADYEDLRDWSVMNFIRRSGTAIIAEDDAGANSVYPQSYATTGIHPQSVPQTDEAGANFVRPQSYDAAGVHPQDVRIVSAESQKLREEVPVTSVRGRVTDTGDAALGGATVTAVREDTEKVYRVTARENGMFRLPLPAGRYRLEFDHEGYKPFETEETVVVQRAADGGRPPRIDIDAGLETITVKINVEVFNAGGEPLDRVRIHVEEDGGGRYRISSGDSGGGNYELSLMPGTYRLELRRDGYRPVTLDDVTVYEDGAVEGTDPVVMDLLTVNGKVTGMHGRPLKDVKVTARDGNLNLMTAVTGKDGLFGFGTFTDLLKPGSYRLEFNKNGYLGFVKDIVIQEDYRAEYEDMTMELLGDVTNTGALDIADAILVLRHITGLVTLDEEEMARARISGNQTLNVGDAILILRNVAGLQTTGIPEGRY